MKRYLILALAGVVASAATLFAIPDRVGSFLFGPVTTSVEGFALNAENWTEDHFSDEWDDKSAKDSDEEILQLNKKYRVFGVVAEEVQAVKRDGHLERFLITFNPDDNQGSNPEKVLNSLRGNIEVFTGTEFVESRGTGDSTAPGYRCRYKEFEIYLGKRETDRVLVAIRRAPATT